ncbi:MAG TPA: hypothetical protein VJR94_05720, partial [Candidatus Nitrosocosmicus sp.]|nr:hypothetical protein [Candidatus Nitrosocosmicus sp.]
MSYQTALSHKVDSSLMMKIMPFNLLLIFLVVVISGTSTTTLINQDVLAQKSDESSGLNFDINSLFGGGKEGFSFDELFPFDQSSSSESSDEESSDNGDSSSQDESAVTDPLGGIDLVFPVNNAEAPQTQTTPSEDESATSPQDESATSPQDESATSPQDESATSPQDESATSPQD